MELVHTENFVNASLIEAEIMRGRMGQEQSENLTSLDLDWRDLGSWRPRFKESLIKLVYPENFVRVTLTEAEIEAGKTSIASGCF